MAAEEATPASTPHRILALYKFTPLPKDNLKELQQELEKELRKFGARGTLLVATEGINGTVCYPFPPSTDEKDPVYEYLQSKFDNKLRTRISSYDKAVFARLKIKLKSEIVTMHQDDVHPTEESVGTYVGPEKWNELLKDPECMVIDTRNEYEIDVGTFQDAVNPHTQSFVEFPDWMKKNISGEKAPKKIAMFCTGGIRCEKATNSALKMAPKDVPVYHLEGGILNYLDSVKPEDSLYNGECYVFDQRVAVSYGLKPSEKYSTSCHACRHPLCAEDLEHKDFVEGLSCQWCVDKITDKQRERFAQRQKQIDLAKKNGTLHIHDPKEVKAQKSIRT
ncbi:MAG: hypothetical protein SGBAC_011990 [Bacillariaceae sp.]